MSVTGRGSNPSPTLAIDKNGFISIGLRAISSKAKCSGNMALSAMIAFARTGRGLPVSPLMQRSIHLSVSTRRLCSSKISTVIMTHLDQVERGEQLHRVVAPDLAAKPGVGDDLASLRSKQ